MNGDGAIQAAVEATARPLAPPVRAPILAILSGIAAAAMFGCVAHCPSYDWFTVRAPRTASGHDESMTVTGLGIFKYIWTYADFEGEIAMTRAGGPDGPAIVIFAVCCAGIAAGSLVVLCLRMSESGRQRLLRVTLNLSMAGAVILVLWQIAWVWKSGSVVVALNDRKMYWGATVDTGLGLYVGLGTAILAGSFVMATAWASLDRAPRWMRMGETAGLAVGIALAVQAAPWNANDLRDCMLDAQRRVIRGTRLRILLSMPDLRTHPSLLPTHLPSAAASTSASHTLSFGARCGTLAEQSAIGICDRTASGRACIVSPSLWRLCSTQSSSSFHSDGFFANRRDSPIVSDCRKRQPRQLYTCVKWARKRSVLTRGGAGIESGFVALGGCHTLPVALY